jgi:SagB-type dehydrogenase family enzyme
LYLELSLGLSARKEIAASSWYLRMNPSSGNLHPTEAYAILPSLPGLPGGVGIYHYAPLHHELEQRARWPQSEKPNAAEFHVGLTSITWREAWKYGERVFRYCQHDVGHALAALRFAAATLGWRVQLLPEWDDAYLARLLGLDRVEDFADVERETPELLVRVMVDETAGTILSPGTDAAMEWFGRANRLSHFHIERLGWAGAICVILRGRSPATRTLLPTVHLALECWRGSSRSCGSAAQQPTGNCSGKPE